MDESYRLKKDKLAKKRKLDKLKRRKQLVSTSMHAIEMQALQANRRRMSCLDHHMSVNSARSNSSNRLSPSPLSTHMLNENGLAI